MERTFTYRNGFLFFIAFWFSALGLVFSLTALRASLVGNHLALKAANGTILTSGPWAWLPILMPALAVPIGLWLFLYVANSKVVLDTEGVRIYNWSRRLTFEASWNDITSVSRCSDPRGGRALTITANDSTALITHSVIAIDELEKFLNDHVSTGVTESPSLARS